MSVNIFNKTEGTLTKIAGSGNGDGDSAWEGTQAEWEALDTEEKAKYKTVYFTDDTDSALIDDTTPSTDKVYSSSKVEEMVLNKNSSKKVAIFGGSVASAGYSQLKDDIKKALNTETVDNYAIGGYGFSSLQGSIQNEVDSAISSGNNYDIFVLWASSNDFTNNQAIGSYKDYTSKDEYDTSKLTTQCGGINYCIKKILDNSPTAEIYFITSHKVYNKESGYDTFYCGNDTALYSYVSAQKQCCSFYSIPVLDLWGMMGINELNRTTYYADTIHLNSAGYDKVKNLILDFLKNGNYIGSPQAESNIGKPITPTYAKDIEYFVQSDTQCTKIIPNGSDANHYIVKNGICMVNLSWTQEDTLPDHVPFVVDLPKPVKMVQCVGISRELTSTGYGKPIYGYLSDGIANGSGYTILKIYGGDNDSRGYRMSFSYAVDE